MKVKLVQQVNKKIPISPKELLNKFEQGKRPGYRHVKDILENQLEQLAEEYKKTFSLNKKNELLAKEREILYQELEYPELTLARNYNAIKKLFGRTVKKDEIKDVLRLFNITGIVRNENLSGIYKHKTQESRINILEKAYLEFSESTDAGLRGKYYTLETLATLEDMNPEYKEKLITVYENLYKHSKNDSLKEGILSAKSDFDKTQVLNSLRVSPNQPTLLNILLFKSKHNDSEITELINKILKNKDFDSNQIQKIAIWGAGKHKNNENFEIIREIALDKNEADIRKREIAIHSVALYLKRKPEEVKEIISKIKNEKSKFAPLGRVLYDKIHGNYHGQKNRELYYLKYNNEEIENFRKKISKYYNTESPLNIQQENACHRATVYLNNILDKIINNGNKYFLQNDTFTKLDPEKTGKRYINNFGGIYNSGDFYDAFDGICTANYNMMNFYRVVNSAHTNVLAHENAHLLNNFLDKKDIFDLHQLYINANNNNLFLDEYAAANPSEYFAQGCMAYATTYLPHSLLINSKDHTRYELMKKDPQLYNFIEYVLKKYH